MTLRATGTAVGAHRHRGAGVLLMLLAGTAHGSAGAAHRTGPPRTAGPTGTTHRTRTTGTTGVTLRATGTTGSRGQLRRAAHLLLLLTRS
ncbi:hypothetical protein SAMN06297387_101264 [Streptomyces zhaozhouensis]|uniref:Uncharacterized protein n=1 Tax=Streptomyces zhaozhouensis TaxID=1300267 RepID=A0A286DIU6_9ACTN|nr:hypothetical protein SAMN06297387_101264 [Streptomyces zhaozhouensis]